MRANPFNVELPDPEPALRTAEVARVLGVSPRAVRTWADEGKIACYKTFGGHRLFAVSEVKRVLDHWGQGAALPAPPDAAEVEVPVVVEVPDLVTEEEGAARG